MRQQSKVYSRRIVCTKSETPSHFTNATIASHQASHQADNHCMRGFLTKHLEGDDTNTSRLGNNTAGRGSSIGSVLVAGSPGALLSDLGGGRGEEVVALVGEALLVRVEVGDDSTLNTGERSVLNKNLSAHAGVDTGDAAVVTGAVDVGGAETDRGEARVDLLKVVVVVGDAELAFVLGGVVVGVTDEGALPL
jgi:hypothetical protein